MKKTFVIFGILLTLGLLVAGCSNSEKIANTDSIDAENIGASTPDIYVDEQIIDETQDVEIGEMI